MDNQIIKVVGFPNHESMWVEVLIGDENEGTGRLDNNAACSSLMSGDIVAYHMGDESTHPRFLKG